MPIYQTTFDVNASAETVWRLLTTLERYGEWNPQIPKATGAIEERGKIHLCLALPRRRHRVEATAVGKTTRR